MKIIFLNNWMCLFNLCPHKCTTKGFNFISLSSVAYEEGGFDIAIGILGFGFMIQFGNEE